ncbi:putative golgin subfamily A member 8I [Gadus chalcogrammus]|uniref:putative golgin subfamily A member 8I n=1 Tax=Gadus chalcogrammus TaxID=1042646 RepID=UPI0024C4863A|nr:putative golgin subfamily A member 8I [Gadus chalcogrammus]XP_056459352.1 putative golgin subfamily A member 8I [Gadus chalcogrammus]
MNWDNQLSSILSAADDSVAKMRERLTSPGKFSKGSPDLFPVREGRSDPGLDPLTLPLLPTRASMLQQPSSSLPPEVQWADLAAIQTQLQMQSQALESLTKKVQSVERERDSQQRRIRLLEEEICSLREESKEMERARADMRRDQSPGTERMMEQWRREIGRELSTLRGHITRATSLSNLEESFSSKLQGEELQHLRREVDQLKARLRGQEEDMFVQQSEVREARRQYERNCKTLEQLTDTNRTHGLDLAKTETQHTRTQQEVRQIRVSVSDLRDEVSRLMLREERPTPARPQHTSASMAPGSQLHSSHGPEPRGEQPDSDSEDFSPTPSLAEVSSDDLSWLDDHEPAPRQKRVPCVRLSTRSRRSDIAGPSSDLGDDDEDDDNDDDLDDDDVHLGLGSDLSLDDL